MIRVGTVFSGIGAIEHALQRMNLKHKIIFACDNGGVDIFGKKINDNFVDIEKEFNYLNSHIDNILIKKPKKSLEFNSIINNLITESSLLNKIVDEKGKSKIKLLQTNLLTFKDDLKINLKEEDNYILNLKIKLKDIFYNFNEIKKTSSNLKCLDKISKVLKETKNFLDLNNNLKFSIYFDNLDVSIKLILITELKNYFKKNYKEEKDIFSKLEEISKDKEYRLIRREIKEIPKNLSQLHNTIKTLEELEQLSNIKEYNKKKEYIDSLYLHKEKSNFVKKIYMENYNLDNRNFHWNISLFDAKEYFNKLDLLVGGSPCQSFSIVGKRGGFEDTRGTLFYEFARILKETSPRFFIYENVKGVLSHDGGQTWQVMKNTFEDTGYKFKDYVFNSKDFGIPQHRERIFVIGFKNEEDYNKFENPKKKELNFKMQNFLEDYVDDKYFLAEKGIKFVTDERNLNKRYTQVNGDIALCQKANQQFNWHGDFIEQYTKDELERMDKIEDKYFLSKSVKDYILSDQFYMNNKPSEELIDLDIARPLTATMHKMHRAGVDNYISYGKALDAKNRRIRKLTPRECFRLMGFSDSFKLVCSDTQLYQQAGNSIVVDVLISIMEKIVDIDA